METEKKLPDLSSFIGTCNYYQHSINRRVTYTDGVQYLAEQVGAYWLLDEIALCQPYEKAVAAERFQVWRLRVAGSYATLACEDGNGNEVFRKPIAFTDFPEPGIDLWFSGGVIMLPSEY